MSNRVHATQRKGQGTPLLILLSFWGAMGCAAPVGSPVTVEALVTDPEAEDGVGLGDIELLTVDDLTTGRGSLFDARGGLQMSVFTVSASAQEGDDFEEMRDLTRGDSGADLSPRMRFDGERWIPEDLTTLTYFTAFAGFEQSWLFARDVIGDSSGATQDHAIVGIEASMVAADIFPLPLLTSDNAAYAAPLDAWLTLRVTAQGGVPFAMALPVVAHEFHHRVFHRNVFGTDEAFAAWRKRLLNPNEEEQTSTRILQGIDEGLADLFSLALTGDIEGLPRTFTQAGFLFGQEADRRDLHGAYANAATYDSLRDNKLDVRHLQACGSQATEDLYAEPSFNFYCLGTVLARALWDGSGRDIEVLRADVMPAANRALPKVGEALASGTLFDVDVFLAPFVAELPPGAVRSSVCESLTERFTSLVEEGRVPSCL